jgi:protein-disulfide isomerase
LSDKTRTRRGASEEGDNGEYVVIKTTHLLIALLPIVLLLGLVIGMVLGVYIWGGSSGIAELFGRATEEAAPSAAAAPSAPSAPIEVDVSADDDPSIGPADAPVTIIEFSDFQCPYCTRFRDETLDQILDTYGDEVRFVYRDFPLTSMHQYSLGAAVAAECADDQGMFWEMHDMIFANQSALDSESLRGYAEDLGLDMDAFDDCVADDSTRDEVLADLADGQSYGVQGTPSFFINGQLLVGAQPFTAFQNIIDQELAAQ